jgi:hypothetical protein
MVFVRILVAALNLIHVVRSARSLHVQVPRLALRLYYILHSDLWRVESLHLACVDLLLLLLMGHSPVALVFQVAGLYLLLVAVVPSLWRGWTAARELVLGRGFDFCRYHSLQLLFVLWRQGISKYLVGVLRRKEALIWCVVRWQQWNLICV